MPGRAVPERRCIASGEVGPAAGLIRFVAGPDGVLVPDLAEKLPGRGVWVSASRAALELAIRKRLFARGLKSPVRIEGDLPALVEALLARRCLEILGLARRAGLVVNGFEKVREGLQSSRLAVLLGASDGAAEGRGRLRRMAAELPVVEIFSVADLSLALGRENVVHAGLAPGGLTDRFLTETARLTGMRSPQTPPRAAESE